MQSNNMPVLCVPENKLRVKLILYKNIREYKKHDGLLNLPIETESKSKAEFISLLSFVAVVKEGTSVKDSSPYLSILNTAKMVWIEG